MRVGISEPIEIAVDSFRREKSELQVHPFVAEQQAGEALDPDPPLRRFLKDGVAARNFFAQPASHLEVMLSFVPGAGHFIEVRPESLLQDQRVGREQLQESAPGREVPALRWRRGPRTTRIVVALQLRTNRLSVDRQDGDIAELFQRSLGGEIEATERGDVVTPPLDAGGHGHPESIQVENPAPHAEFGNLGHGGDPPIPHLLQMTRYLQR